MVLGARRHKCETAAFWQNFRPAPLKIFAFHQGVQKIFAWQDKISAQNASISTCANTLQGLFE
ncbi:hypothetical protein [Anaerotruncus colihominis]|uniref:hypothetical protein n=1 Tax=Anaerotruncus colihominis TaxID=169435 RepID=UPI00189A751F|nr:hypothetical protein [Anaerotruncus colihominis]